MTEDSDPTCSVDHPLQLVWFCAVHRTTGMEKLETLSIFIVSTQHTYRELTLKHPFLVAV